MTDIPVDLDQFKQAWQRLDRRLTAQHAMAFGAFRTAHLRSMRWRLWPLYGGQFVQLALGVVMMAVGVAGWWGFARVPHLVVAGALVHAYGVALVIAAGRTVWFLSRIDYAAPVIEIQQEIGRVRAWYMRCGFWLGQAWWFIWMPCLMVFAAMAGFDVWHRAPKVLGLGAAIGFAGMLLTIGASRLSRRPGWHWLSAMNEDAMAGASLRRARAVLEEIRRFEDEPPAA
jgi:hypothetical protein